ncbi:PD-(D/E)XK motif protein [Ruegeria atlantica]|uniref:PD-(D/E)XK motif protein n=1 Tax=Ruegeria atlantica TaxID=81569 RepID=UPI00147F61D2|nr:PD-(D/E)XK motif protein [Ruegeria atlantica]
MMLFEAYQSLIGRFPEDCIGLFGSKVSWQQGLWLALNEDGFPHVLLESCGSDGQPDLELKSVAARFDCPCDFRLQDGSELVGKYTLVSLRDDDPDLVRVFLRLLEEALLTNGDHGSAAHIRQHIVAIADIFARQSDDVRDVLGLWGELHVIRSSKDKLAAVKAWSSSPRARYDFVSKDFALEVKTTLRAARQHRFSLEQLRPQEDLTIFIASIVLVEQQGGETASELMDSIYEAIAEPEIRSQFYQHCIRKGGADIYGSALRLSTLPDGNSLQLFNAETLPVPSFGQDAPIKNVRFDIFMDSCQSIPPEIHAEKISFA